MLANNAQVPSAFDSLHTMVHIKLHTTSINWPLNLWKDQTMRDHDKLVCLAWCVQYRFPPILYVSHSSKRVLKLKCFNRNNKDLIVDKLIWTTSLIKPCVKATANLGSHVRSRVKPSIMNYFWFKRPYY